MNVKELANSTSGPVRAAVLALEAKVMMLEHDLAEERAKNDPLADAVESVLSGFEGRKHAESYANQIRAALEARGLEIRSKNDD